MDAAGIVRGRIIEVGLFDRILVTAARPDGDKIRVDGCRSPYRAEDWVDNELIDPATATVVGR
jgi:hypothetical protein